MHYQKIERNGTSMFYIPENEVFITDPQSALDLAATITYETGCSRIILEKSAFCEEFFVLSTQLAGEILQKFVNYGIHMAVIGDYSGYTSKPLHDFIYECNHGKDFFFVSEKEEAIEKLCEV